MRDKVQFTTTKENLVGTPSTRIFQTLRAYVIHVNQCILTTVAAYSFGDSNIRTGAIVDVGILVNMAGVVRFINIGVFVGVREIVDVGIVIRDIRTRCI